MGRPRKATSHPQAETPAAPAHLKVATQLPPSAPPPLAPDVELPSRFDPPQELQAMVEGEMRRRGVDPEKMTKREFFELLMWEWTLQGNGKQIELGARILGRGYIGERAGDDGKAQSLVVEDYKDGISKMMGAAPGKKVKQ